MTRRRHRPSDKDLALWRAVTRDVEPLVRLKPPEAQETASPAAPPTGSPAQANGDGRTAGEAAAKTRHHAARRPQATPAPPPLPRPPAPPARLGPGSAPGVDRRTADRLRRGRLGVDARLDLHGLTQHAAHDALVRFVLDAHARGRRSLLVITGKGTFGDGRGILRARVPDWLNDPPLRDKVLAIETAQPKDGGAGALYVLLKRRREG